ncbi:TraY domain-containing protein [Vibrio europaeus]|uniref:TraY domain-containing protein n=1 Tax=Vibrio europaeus TaxID=300876 RepID=UPI00233EB9AA|nr:TraY domain-containing protein [Vibrio europaeus]MDC5711171.1 TraY domain-containing protein [Vibrio europaeus]MDC5713200.1 TraY domain-containing protein [Vibrio europaeus]
MNSETPEKLEVLVVLEGEYVQKFQKSAVASERSNRKEAAIRIKDHLDRFSSITTLGQCTERKEKS